MKECELINSFGLLAVIKIPETVQSSTDTANVSTSLLLSFIFSFLQAWQLSMKIKYLKQSLSETFSVDYTLKMPLMFFFVTVYVL